MRMLALGLFLIIILTPIQPNGQSSLEFAVLDTMVQSTETNPRGQNLVSMNINFEIWNEIHQTYSLLSGNRSCTISIQITIIDAYEICYPQNVIVGNGIYEFNLSFFIELSETISRLSLSFDIKSAPVGKVYDAEIIQFNNPEPGEAKETFAAIPPPQHWGVSPLSPQQPLHFRFSSVYIHQSYDLIPVTDITFASKVGAYNNEQNILILTTFSPILGFINFSSEMMELEQEPSFPFKATDHCFTPGKTSLVSLDTISLINYNSSFSSDIILNLSFVINSQAIFESHVLTVRLFQQQVEIVSSTLPLQLAGMRDAKPLRGDCPPSEPISPIEDPLIIVSATTVGSTAFLAFLLHVRRKFKQRKAKITDSLYPE